MTIVMGNDQLAAEPGFIGMTGKIKQSEHISEVPFSSFSFSARKLPK